LYYIDILRTQVRILKNGGIVMNLSRVRTNTKVKSVANTVKSGMFASIVNNAIFIENNAKINTNTVKILGVKHNINLYYKNVKTPTINLKKQTLDIILPNKYKKIAEEEILKVLTQKLYDKIAETEIEKIMEKVRIETGIAPEDIQIKRLYKSLASCDVENSFITINPDIVAYDEKTIEYVILHEFCHLKYKIRTKNFWKLVGTYMPNYEQYAIALGKLSY
jgi:hypothetical protein